MSADRPEVYPDAHQALFEEIPKSSRRLFDLLADAKVPAIGMMTRDGVALRADNRVPRAVGVVAARHGQDHPLIIHDGGRYNECAEEHQRYRLSVGDRSTGHITRIQAVVRIVLWVNSGRFYVE